VGSRVRQDEIWMLT